MEIERITCDLRLSLMNGNNTSCHLYSCHKETNNAIAVKGKIVMEII